MTQPHEDEPEEVFEFTVEEGALLPDVGSEWGFFKKKTITRAARINGPFVVVTTEGELRCEDGWLALDSRGHPYPIAADEFNNIYEEVNPNG